LACGIRLSPFIANSSFSSRTMIPEAIFAH
jgi:hypothetical protein